MHLNQFCVWYSAVEKKPQILAKMAPRRNIVIRNIKKASILGVVCDNGNTCSLAGFLIFNVCVHVLVHQINSSYLFNFHWIRIIAKLSNTIFFKMRRVKITTRKLMHANHVMFLHPFFPFVGNSLKQLGHDDKVVKFIKVYMYCTNLWRFQAMVRRHTNLILPGMINGSLLWRNESWRLWPLYKLSPIPDH